MIIIFDLDGTLINTIDDLGQACNHALSACGFPTHKIEDYPRLVGNGINALIERALPEGHRNEETVLRLREYFVPYYDEHNCDLTRPYEGIPELLSNLKAQGHFLAVASNKYQAATEKIVAQLFPGIFNVVLGERVGVPRKPDPQIVWDIVKLLNKESRTKNQDQSPTTEQTNVISLDSMFLAPNSILYIGDSLVDAETAKAANLPLVACAWGFCTKEQLATANPSYMINHPSELINILCNE